MSTMTAVSDARQAAARFAVPKFRTFKLPPRRFDPLTASERELLVHGLPRQPNPETHPRLAALWRRLASQRHEFVTPELEVIESMRRGVDRDLLARRAISEREIARGLEKDALVGRRDTFLDLKRFAEAFGQPSRWADAQVNLGQLRAAAPALSNNWSGAYVPRPAAEPINTVVGTWRVPAVSAPTTPATGKPADGTYLCGVWIGIDGTSGSNDVLQAGTASQVVVSGGKSTMSFFVWTEWFTAPAVAVANYPVQGGDLISCSVCAPSGNTHGAVLFNNLTSGLTTSIGIEPPAGVSLVGNVAEWIVEDPQKADKTLFPFPNYGSTYFGDCMAGSKSIELDLSTGREMDLVDGSGKIVSTGTIESARTVFCRYGSE